MQIFLFFVEEHVAELECLISWSGIVLLSLATVFCGYLNQPPRKLAVRELFLPVLHTAQPDNVSVGGLESTRAIRSRLGCSGSRLKLFRSRLGNCSNLN